MLKECWSQPELRILVINKFFIMYTGTPTILAIRMKQYIYIYSSVVIPFTAMVFKCIKGNSINLLQMLF